MISVLSILAADLETCLTYTLLPCVGFGLHPVPFAGSLDFIVDIFTSPFLPVCLIFFSFIYHGGLVYFCGIARSAFGCGIINLDLNDFGAALGRI
jgi:hypothetical protein